jgi:hypothetical protein
MAGTDMPVVQTLRNSTAFGSFSRLALAAVDEPGNPAEEAEHDSEPNGTEERFNACEHGVSLSAYVRR